MWLRERNALLASVLLGAGIVAATLPASAQRPAPRNFLPILSPRTPASALRKHSGAPIARWRLRKLPVFAKRKTPITRRNPNGSSSGFTPQFFDNTLDPTLYSSVTNYVNPAQSEDGFDSLWSFPTVGRDAAKYKGRINVPMTAQAQSPTGFQTLHVSFGQLGKPARLTSLSLGGNIRRINAATGALTDANGVLLVIVFDGVDAINAHDVGDYFTATPTTTGNMAFLGNESPAAFIVPFSNTDTPGIYTISSAVAGEDILISDPQGRFGILVGKIESSSVDPNLPDDGPLAQWIAWGNAPVGPNAVWRANPITWQPLDATPATMASDSAFNQSVRNNNPNNVFGINPNTQQPDANTRTHGTLNYFIQWNGVNLDGTTAQTGLVSGNLRRRGMAIPAQGVAEPGPQLYDLFFYQPGTGNLKQTVSVYTQPSYDANGALIDNYFIEGVPVGNYDVEVVARPTRSANGFDSIANPNLYPFGDFAPGFVANLSVGAASGGASALSSRVVRLGDMAGSGDPNDPSDGIVDLFDLVALFDAFGSNANPPDGPADPDFNPLADLAGADPDQLENLNPFGFPDGIVDLLDLVALFNQFGLGDVEVP